MSEPLQISVHVEEKRYQPTQQKTVVPDWEPVEVTPDKGYALSKVTVEGMPEPTESETFTENGTYDVGRIGTAVVDVDVDLQDKTVTPTEQTQTVESDVGYDGLATVTVNPIPPEYVVPTGSVEITKNGPVSVAGKTTANVNVPQGVFPSGTKLITENVTGEDVTNYAAVDVAVPGPSGTKLISITSNGTTTEDVSEYADAEITVNTLPAKGFVFEDYDADGYPQKLDFVGMTEIPAHYFEANHSGYFMNHISQNFHVKSNITKIGRSAFAGSSFKNYVIDGPITFDTEAFYNANLVQIVCNGDVVSSGNRWCGYWSGNTTLKTVIFNANIHAIVNGAFQYRNGVTLYDFSHCTAIPPLYNVQSLGHASGCVIRIPAALSDMTLGTGNGWESATNWSALTNIVWEVV